MAHSFTAFFEPKALRSIARMEGWQGAFAGALAKVMPKNAQAIVDHIPNVTHWQSGDGTLDHSFYVLAESPYVAAFTSDLPYWLRQWKGFHGADSLGRVYDQAGDDYIGRAIDAAEPQIEDQTEAAALGVLGGL